MNEDVLLYDVDGSVARLTLNRPKAMNSLNLAVLAGMLRDRRLTQIEADDEMRVLVSPPVLAPLSVPART